MEGRTMHGELRKILGLLLVVPALMWLPACGGSSSDGSSSTNDATANIVFTDDPSDDLLTFTMDIDDMVLVDNQGNRVSLSGTPFSIDWLSVQNVKQLVNSSPIPPGTYVQMDVVFSNASGVDLTGQQVTITPSSGTISLIFDHEFTFNGGQTSVLEVDLDVDDSLTNLGNGAFALSPTVSLEIDGLDDDVDDLEGTITSISSSSFDVALSHGGTVQVDTDANTLFDINGQTYQGATGFALLAVNDEVEISGNWNATNTAVIADEVETKDHHSGGTTGGGTEFEDLVYVPNSYVSGTTQDEFRATTGTVTYTIVMTDTTVIEVETESTDTEFDTDRSNTTVPTYLSNADDLGAEGTFDTTTNTITASQVDIELP